jgi:EmrB/QacA subfamily drug resistance transporter
MNSSPPLSGADDTGTAGMTENATIAAVTIVQFLTPFMFSAVGVALPALGTEFSANAVQLGLIGMAYTLGIALFLLPVGRFADIYGRKKIFISGTAAMIVTTVALAAAPNIELFILFRFLQGVGAAMITATSLAILSCVIPAHRRGRAMGIVVSGVYIGLSAGPTLAGLMISYLGWRWIFYTAVPVELAALAIAVWKLKGEWADARGKRFDAFGSLIYMTALFALIAGVTQLKTMPEATWMAMAGMAGLVIFLVYESKNDSPIIDVGLLATNRTFSLSNAATLINYTASFGVVFFFSIYLQTIRGIPPKTAGLILVVQPVIQALLSPLAGRLSDIRSPARIATFGMGLCAAGLAVSVFITADIPLVVVFLVLILLGVGFGFFSTPNTAAIMASVPPVHYGTASSLLATMRAMGMLGSMTLITVLLSVFMGRQPVTPETGPAFMTTMRWSLMIFALMSIAGIFCSLGRISPRQDHRSASGHTDGCR